MDYRRFEIYVYGSPAFSTFFQGLPSPSELRTKLQNMIDKLKEVPDMGDPIQRSLWPRDYRNLELTNLFRYEVDNSRRATYTIRRMGKRIEVQIIEFFPTHKEYERRFQY